MNPDKLFNSVNPAQLLWENYHCWCSWPKWPVKVSMAKMIKTFTIGNPLAKMAKKNF